MRLWLKAKDFLRKWIEKKSGKLSPGPNKRKCADLFSQETLKLYGPTPEFLRLIPFQRFFSCKEGLLGIIYPNSGLGDKAHE